MTAEIRDEMLSGYLDGELSAEDRAAVEAWLASNAECRQLLDELRAVRNSLKSLPPHQLSADLGPAILRRAESALPGDSQPRDVTGKITPASLARDWWSRGGLRRVFWPAAVIAASLLIALFDADRKPAQKQVSLTRAPQGETFIGARPNAELSAAANSPADAAQFHDEPANAAGGKDGAGGDLAKKQGVPLSNAVSAARSNRLGRAKPAAAPAEISGISDEGLQPAAATSPRGGLTIVCDVSAAFIHDRAFEKLLDEQEIKYWRADQLARQETDASDRGERTAPRIAGQPYVVEATTEQVDRIIARLRNDASGVSNVAKDQTIGELLVRARDYKPAGPVDKPAQLYADRPPRVQFLLRTVQPRPAAEKTP